MKTAYLGGIRGSQAGVYRPGAGWSGADSSRRLGRRPRAFNADSRLRVSPLTTTQRGRPGLRTKAVIVSTVLAVTVVLTMALNGMGPF